MEELPAAPIHECDRPRMAPRVGLMEGADAATSGKLIQSSLPLVRESGWCGAIEPKACRVSLGTSSFGADRQGLPPGAGCAACISFMSGSSTKPGFGPETQGWTIDDETPPLGCSLGRIQVYLSASTCLLSGCMGAGIPPGSGGRGGRSLRQARQNTMPLVSLPCSGPLPDAVECGGDPES